MAFITIILIAVSLAMDAFAVSISNAACTRDFCKQDAVRQGAFFGGFQFMMPLVGWFLGSSVKGYIEAVDHWIAFLLLAVIGANMIRNSLKGDGLDASCDAKGGLTNKTLTLQAVATSIDALAVGISFALLEVNVFQACIIIGIISFVLSCVGAWAGKYLGDRLQSKAEIAGGVVLILIGTKILFEHMFIGG